MLFEVSLHGTDQSRLLHFSKKPHLQIGDLQSPEEIWLPEFKVQLPFSIFLCVLFLLQMSRRDDRVSREEYDKLARELEVYFDLFFLPFGYI